MQEDIRKMDEAYNSLNNDERTYEEYITEKINKINQVKKDIDQLKEKIERAAKQLINYSRESRRAKNSTDDGPTLEEKDFKLRDLWDFNKTKSKELVDISLQYPTLQQTLNLLFTQANIPFVVNPGSAASGSIPSSSRTSRSSSRSRQNSLSASSTSSTSNQSATDRSQSKSGAKLVNIGLGKRIYQNFKLYFFL
jgi:hypothetical protein